MPTHMDYPSILICNMFCKSVCFKWGFLVQTGARLLTAQLHSANDCIAGLQGFCLPYSWVICKVNEPLREAAQAMWCTPFNNCIFFSQKLPQAVVWFKRQPVCLQPHDKFIMGFFFCQNKWSSWLFLLFHF